MAGQPAVARLSAVGAQVSLFIDADPIQIDAAAESGAPFIEIHTGRYADATTDAERNAEFKRIAAGASYAAGKGLKVNAGHGLHYHNVKAIAAIPELYELNIGHAIIGRAAFDGLRALGLPWTPLARRLRARMALAHKGIAPTLRRVRFCDIAHIDGGARTAAVESARAANEQAAATYRQTVLTALQEVEDNLTAATALAQEQQLQTEALAAAQRALDVVSNQYRAGTVGYLNVITAQASVLSSQRSLIDVKNRRLASVNTLLKNVAGSWAPRVR